MTLKQSLLASARVAELKHAAAELSSATRPPARVVLTREAERDRRRLLMLLARERRRNAKLVELLS
jgi:hypothetical protein